jgi:hypothetical protein
VLSVQDGKLLLDALEAVRLPRGWRTVSLGVPRSTVYFKARGTEHVLARAYCRNLKLKAGAPFGRIRLEAEQRLEPRAAGLERAAQPEFVASIWQSRYTGLSSRVRRLAREVQTVQIAELVRTGELTYSQGERLGMFLDLERLGLARTYYSNAAYSDRRRLAAKLGFTANESGQDALEVELSELVAPYERAVEESAAGRPGARPDRAAAGAAADPPDTPLGTRTAHLRDRNAPGGRDRRRIARAGSCRPEHNALDLRASRSLRPRTCDGGPGSQQTSLTLAWASVLE